eukprot:6461808-Amphidinium_carterae.2
MSQIQELYVGGMWSMMPETTWHLKFNSEIFVLLSRLGCLVEDLLAFPHRQMPCQLFSLLNQPEQHDILVKVPACMQDQFTRGILKQWPTLTGTACLSTLRLHACHQMVDISQVEALHGSIRRQVFVKSTQTWSIALKQVSSEYLFQRFRSQLAPKGKGKKVTTTPDVLMTTLPPIHLGVFTPCKANGMYYTCMSVYIANPKKEKSVKHPGKAGRGGSWRAFIRAVSLGTKGMPNLSAVAQEYRKLKSANQLPIAVKQLGKVATAAHKRGQVWKTTRQLLGERKKEVEKAFYEQHKTGDFAEVLFALSNEASGSTIDRAMQLAKAMARLDAATEREAIVKRMEEEAKFDDTIGKKHVTDVLLALPALSFLTLKCSPHPGNLL